jgi:D-alanyl-D-alanine carboxypeptidase (penicillin-binding protein 5/6)
VQVVPPPAPLPTTAPPTISAESAIVVDALTGRILAGKNPDQARAVASTQKLMTALLAIEAGPLASPVTIQLSDTEPEPTKLYLKPGEVYPRRDLIRVILVKSANDAAAALARDVAGNPERVSEVMTRRARALGMRNTVFQNAHGLTVPGQYSSARDLAILARAAYRHSYIRECMRTRKFVFTYNDGRTRTLENTNKLLKRFPYATGMKTGTTNASGKCLVSSAEYNGRVAIAVVLKGSNSSIWDESERLLRWALNIPSDPLPPAASN